MDNEAPKRFTWKVKVFVSSTQKMQRELWERPCLRPDGCWGTKHAPRVYRIKNIYIWGPGSVRFVCAVFYGLHWWGQKHHCVGLIWSWITRSLHSSALHLSLFGCKCWSICLCVGSDNIGDAVSPAGFSFCSASTAERNQTRWLAGSLVVKTNLCWFICIQLHTCAILRRVTERLVTGRRRHSHIHSQRISTGSHLKQLFESKWQQSSLELPAVRDNKDLLGAPVLLWRSLTMHQPDGVHLTPVCAPK